MAPLRHSPPPGTAPVLLTLAVVAAATLTACGGRPSGPDAVPGPRRTGVATPKLCETLERKLVNKALRGKVKSCSSSTTQPDEHLVQFSTASKPTGDDIGQRQVTVTYLLRQDPNTGVDRWTSLAKAKGQRVKLLSVGDDAVFDYGAGRGPDLYVLKGDLILLVTHEGPGSTKELPSRLTAIAAEVLAQTR